MTDVIPAGGAQPNAPGEAPRPARPALAVAWLAGLALVALVALVLGIGLGIRGDDIRNHAIGVAIGLAALLPFAVDQGRAPQRRHVLLTLISLVYFIYFSLPVWTVYLPSGSTIEFPGALVLRSDDVLLAQSAALVGLLLLFVGYAIPLVPLLVRTLPKPRRDWSPRVTISIAALMIPLGLAVYIGSVVGLIPQRLGSGGLGALSRAPYFGVALLMIAYLRFHSRVALMLVLSAVPILMGFYFFTGMKERFFMAPVMAAMALLVTHRRIPTRWVLAGFAAFVLFYPIAQAQRAFVRDMTVLESLTNPGAVVSEALRATSGAQAGEYIQKGLVSTANRTNGLMMTGVVMHDTPSRVPFQGGWTIANIPIAFIPRVIWPGKPIFDVGQTITDLYGVYGIQSSSGLPWVGELYWNFGWPGITIGMIILGMFIRGLHEVIFRQPMTTPLLLAGVIVCYTVPRNVENFLLAPVGGIFLDLGPLAIAHFLVRNRAGRPQSAPWGEQVRA